MIDPLDKDSFMESMKASESVGEYSENAVGRFYNWMYSHQDGVIQTCAFPVPTENKDASEMGQGKWIHARTYNEFEDFCNTHSGLWRYHVYSGVNTLSETPRYGRGDTSNVDNVGILSFDIELDRESYGGSSKEEVWWTYQYALAEIKYINEEYGVWPLVVMSENGIHLHYRVDFDCTDEYLYNRQHVYSKFITKQAMNNEYVDSIEARAPEHIEFAQDDVSDPVRVMKVPGTLGIKSDSGRLCGLIHEPSRSDAGVITESDIDPEPDELKDYFAETCSASKAKSGSTPENVEVDVSPSELSDELKKRVHKLVRNDDRFEMFWLGDDSNYDSRSEYEFAFIVKLLKHGFNPSEVSSIMWASGASKWAEEDDHYRERSIENAVEYFDGEVVKDSTNGSFSFSER